MSAIEKNQTWSLVDVTKDKKAIGLKWVFKTKYNPDGTLLKHKASGEGLLTKERDRF